MQPRTVIGSDLLFQNGQVVPIHGDDVVEAPEIGLFDATSADPFQRITAALRGSARPAVCRFVDVVGMGASRVDLDVVTKPLLLDQVPEDAFGCRRPADIAHADEQNG